MGTVYLIHFHHKLNHAGHYVGYTDNIEKRMSCHQNGNGSKLMKAISVAGISWEVARIWQNVDRNFERSLKNRKNTPKLCPVCNKKLKGETK